MQNHAGALQRRFFPAKLETEGDDAIFNTLLTERLPKLIAAIHEALLQADRAMVPELPSKLVDAGLLAQLEALLANDDTAAINFLAENQQTLRQTLRLDFDEVRRQIEAFDFPVALERVRAALATLASK